MSWSGLTFTFTDWVTGGKRESMQVNCSSKGLIKHTVSKGSFNENCYYTFGDMITFVSAVNGLRLEDDQCSERDTNLLLGQQGSPWHHPQIAPGFNGSSKMPFWGPGGGETVNYGVFGAQPAGSDARMPRPPSDTSSSEADQRSQLSGPFPKSYQPMTTFAHNSHNDSSNRGANGSEEMHSNGHNHPELASGNTGHYHYLNPSHFSVESPVV